MLTSIHVSVITGFEGVARREVQQNLGARARLDRGAVRFEIDATQIPQALKLRSVDNLYAVVYDDSLQGLRKMSESDAMDALRTILPAVNWAHAVECWEIARNRKIYGSSAQIKDQMREFVTDGTYHQVTDNSPTFRVTCNRAGEKHQHSFTSMEAARVLGAQLNNVFGWKPDMKNYDIEIILNVREDAVRVMVKLNDETMFKRNVCAYGPTTMRSTMCYCMLSLAQPLPGQVIVDAMCGGGSIPLEGALAFPGTVFLGGDNHEKALERCLENTKPNLDYMRGSSLGFAFWDASMLPLSDSSIDAIVTDLPFGKKIGSLSDNRLMYPKLATEWIRVVRPGGRLVVMTHDKRSWESAMKRDGNQWRTESTHMVNVGGLTTLCSVMVNMK